MIKPVKTNLVNIWEDSDEIIHVEFLEHFEISDDDAKEYLRTAFNSTDNKAHFVLMDLRRISYFDSIGIKHLIAPETERYTKAVAALINISSPFISNGINFLLKFKNDPFPIRLFTTEKECIDWLLSLKKESTLTKL